MTLAQYMDWPHEVSLETLAKCNAACTFCPYTTLERIGAKMPDEMIERIVGELRGHPLPFYFSPFKVNEPFLDKRLLPLLRMVNAVLPQAALRVFTNGSTLTDANVDGVARLQRVAHLWCSLNDYRADAYRDLMGLDFGRTAANLDRLHKREFPHPVQLSRVRQDDGHDEPFAAYCKDRWPRFGVTLIKRDGWLGHVDPSDPSVPDAGCGRWYELSIMATGKVALCCMDGTGEHSIGDLNANTLHEVYNAPHWRRRRELALSRRAVSPCNRCTY